MLTWRITRASYRALDGDGARIAGARWNSAGRAVVYTAAHASLAALEYLVHIDPENVPDDLRLLAIEMPEDVRVETMSVGKLPKDWQTTPPGASTKAVGDAWLTAAQVAVLAVPSIVVPRERNYLLNPLHPDAARVAIVSDEPFKFDPRLLTE